MYCNSKKKAFSSIGTGTAKKIKIYNKKFTKYKWCSKIFTGKFHPFISVLIPKFVIQPYTFCYKNTEQGAPKTKIQVLQGH
jgi:hypothetical protein